jgi:WD40 repeat protein
MEILEKIKYYTILANYFSDQPHFFDGDRQKKPNIRKCMEQPRQQTKAELWDEVTETLCNLDFIQAKACAKMTYDLVNDFNTVLQIIPDNAENIREENERQSRMDKYTQDLIAYAKGEITELEVPETVPLWSEKKINAEIERMKANPTRLDSLNDFRNFLGQESNNLQNFAWEYPYFAKQQAWNYADIGPVCKTAIRLSKEIKENLILQTSYQQPKWNPLPKAIKILRGHTAEVNAIAVTPNFKVAISGSKDKTCILWDLDTGNILKKLIGHTSSVNDVAITPDGKKAISGSLDNICIIWDLNSGRLMHTLKGHTNSITSVDITPDGKIAISGSDSIFCDTEGDTCIFWDLDTGKILRTLKTGFSRVTAVSITPSGNMAIIGSDEKSCLYNRYSNNTIQFFKGIDGHVSSIDITPNCQKAIFGIYDKPIIIWDLFSEKIFQILQRNDDTFCPVAITPDGNRAISGSSDRTCIIWDIKSGNVIQMLEGHTSSVNDVAINPDGKMAISCSLDKTCILWDLNASGSFQKLDGHDSGIYDFSITPDGKKAISSHYSSDRCFVWNLKTGNIISTLKGHYKDIEVTVITPDSKRAISISYNKCVFWNLNSGKVKKTMIGHTYTIFSIAITPDGNRAISGGHDKCVLWNLNSGKAMKTMRGHEADYIVITPDGKKALISSLANGHIIKNLITGKIIRDNFIRSNHPKHREGTITPDGKLVISCTSKNTIEIWKLNYYERSKYFVGHTDFITNIVISPDGTKIISSSMDNTCIIWNLKTGQIIHKLVHTSSINASIVTLDGSCLISNSDRSCIIWNIDKKEKIGIFAASSTIRILEISYYANVIIVGEKSGKISILNVAKEFLYPKHSILTIRKIWNFELQRYLPPSADCPLCGHRFSPPDSVLSTINNITKKVGLRPEQSPCMELPDEAWEDPVLLGNCPKCKGELKFNPFIAGGD